MFEILSQPGTRWVFLGIMLLCVPFIWRLRLRARTSSVMSLRSALWLVYAVSSLLFVSSFLMAAGFDVRSLMEGQLMLGLAMIGLVLGNPIARLIVGPKGMNVEPRYLSRYWTWSTLAGIAYIAVGIFVFSMTKHVFNMGPGH